MTAFAASSTGCMLSKPDVDGEYVAELDLTPIMKSAFETSLGDQGIDIDADDFKGEVTVLYELELDDGEYTIDDVLIHDAHCQDNFLHQQLAIMDGTNLPVALGVIRDVDAPSYETDVTVQMRKIQVKHRYKNLRDMILDGDTWERK